MDADDAPIAAVETPPRHLMARSCCFISSLVVHSSSTFNSWLKALTPVRRDGWQDLHREQGAGQGLPRGTTSWNEIHSSFMAGKKCMLHVHSHSSPVTATQMKTSDELQTRLVRVTSTFKAAKNPGTQSQSWEEDEPSVH